MRRNIIGFLIWAAVYAASLAANLGSFWMGDGAALYQLWVTLLYGAVCLIFLCAARNNRRWMKHVWFWGMISVAAGILCLLARVGTAWAAIPALILGGALFTSFYGLTYWVVLEDWDVFYTAMLALSVIWTAVGALLLWRLKGRGNSETSE